MRELTYRTDQLLHPQYQDGKRLWTDPEVADIVDRLHNGDPTLGWEGDPRLALYFVQTPEGGRWELQRYEADGTYRVVCRSKPGLALDLGLIQHLVAHDSRRRSHEAVIAAIDAENERVQRDKDAVLQDQAAEAYERVAHGLVKDVGHHY